MQITLRLIGRTRWTWTPRLITVLWWGTADWWLGNGMWRGRKLGEINQYSILNTQLSVPSNQYSIISISYDQDGGGVACRGQFESINMVLCYVKSILIRKLVKCIRSTDYRVYHLKLLNIGKWNSVKNKQWTSGLATWSRTAVWLGWGTLLPEAAGWDWRHQKWCASKW